MIIPSSSSFFFFWRLQEKMHIKSSTQHWHLESELKCSIELFAAATVRGDFLGSQLDTSEGEGDKDAEVEIKQGGASSCWESVDSSRGGTHVEGQTGLVCHGNERHVWSPMQRGCAMHVGSLLFLPSFYLTDLFLNRKFFLSKSTLRFIHN